MSEHLTAGQIESYLRRTLPPDELLRADSHLAECADCQSRLASNVSAITARADVRAAFQEIAHLQFEEMETYLDGDASSEIRSMVEAHVGACTQCARELTDLRAFMLMPQAAPQHIIAARKPSAESRGWFSNVFRSPVYSAAAAAAIVLLAVVLFRYSGPSRTSNVADQLQSVQTPVAAPASSAVFELKDGSRQISIGPGSDVTGLEDFPTEYRDRISDALTSDHFAPPSAAESTWARRELSSARAHYSDSHLLLGVIALHAGNFPAARAEFSALADENPGSPVATGLLRKLDGLAK